ncbi:hypothetical protein FOZ62_011264, partial [Perkinsus olseni]
ILVVGRPVDANGNEISDAAPPAPVSTAPSLRGSDDGTMQEILTTLQKPGKKGLLLYGPELAAMHRGRANVSEVMYSYVTTLAEVTTCPLCDMNLQWLWPQCLSDRLCSPSEGGLSLQAYPGSGPPEVAIGPLLAFNVHDAVVVLMIWQVKRDRAS